MRVKRIICTVAMMAALVSTAAFDDVEKSAIRKSVASAEARLKSATALDGKAITLLPVKGDSDGYCERLVIGALVNAGKTCVVSNDEKTDERFRRILKEIAWDERQTTLKSIDPRTADELGHLKSTQILIEARLDVVRRGRKRTAVAELDLLAYAIKTKQYVWTAHISLDGAGHPWPNPADFNVMVDFKGDNDAAGLSVLVASAVRNAVAGYGFRVNAEGKHDLSLAASFSRETFDKSGGYLVFKGMAGARLASATGDGIIYEKTFSANGARALGEDDAVRNLANALSAQMLKWLDETLAPGVLFAKHPDLADAVGL